MSEKTGVLQKLNKARQDFHKLKLEKTGHNKFAGYKYFELGDFLVPAIDVFCKNNLSAIISFSREMATMTITDIEDGSAVVISSPMGNASLKGAHEVQNIGAVETYQRRYLWVAALEIVEHDAIDSAEPQQEAPAKVRHNNRQVKPSTAAADLRLRIQEALRDGKDLTAVECYQSACDQGDNVADTIWNGLACDEQDKLTELMNQAWKGRQ